jgi:hypothetical protein
VNSLIIDARQTAHGLEILFRESKHVLNYTDEILRAYPQEAKDVLFDNLVYAETVHFPLTFRRRAVNPSLVRRW